MSMTNEEKLEAIYEMTRQNHEILKSIRRQQYFSNAVKLFYWLVVLGALGGAYYYVRPFMGVIGANSTKIQDTFNQIDQFKNNLPETKVINQMFQGLQKSAENTPDATTTAN